MLLLKIDYRYRVAVHNSKGKLGVDVQVLAPLLFRNL